MTEGSRRNARRDRRPSPHGDERGGSHRRDGAEAASPTRRLARGAAPEDLAYPLVAKPRFGSWGREVALCSNRDELLAVLHRGACEPWLDVGGIAQELVPPQGHDLRVIVADDADDETLARA